MNTRRNVLVGSAGLITGIIGGASASLSGVLNSNPNSGLPAEKDTIKFTREINNDKITLSYYFPNYVGKGGPHSEISFNKNIYVKQANQSKLYHNQIKDAISDDFVSNVIVDEFIPSYSEEEINRITNFVQNIKYSRDWKTTESKNYCRHPVETLVDNVGDCKDKTTLLYAILHNLGYDVGYVIYPQHIAPIVSTENIDVDLSNVDTVEKTKHNDYVVLESTYTNEIGKTSYKKENIIYSYVEKNDEFNIRNYLALTDQIRKMIDLNRLD